MWITESSSLRKSIILSMIGTIPFATFFLTVININEAKLISSRIIVTTFTKGKIFAFSYNQDTIILSIRIVCTMSNM